MKERPPYEDFDTQDLRDLCGAGELRYPAHADKTTLIWILENADDWDEIYGDNQ